MVMKGLHVHVGSQILQAAPFVAVNGGMADNLEVSLYGQRFEAAIVDAVGGGEPVTLVGRHCESGDMLSEGVLLRDPAPVIFVDEGRARAVVRRETYDDLIVRDMPI